MCPVLQAGANLNIEQVKVAGRIDEAQRPFGIDRPLQLSDCPMSMPRANDAARPLDSKPRHGADLMRLNEVQHK